MELIEKMKKPEPKVSAGEVSVAPAEVPQHLKKMPHVADLLLSPCWEGGDFKGDVALFVFVTPTLVKLLVKVESPGLKLMVTGRSWDEAWAALELVLRGDDVPWESDAPRERKGRKKSK
jgi:hypothetical protein